MIFTQVRFSPAHFVVAAVLGRLAADARPSDWTGMWSDPRHVWHPIVIWALAGAWMFLIMITQWLPEVARVAVFRRLCTTASIRLHALGATTTAADEAPLVPLLTQLVQLTGPLTNLVCALGLYLVSLGRAPSDTSSYFLVELSRLNLAYGALSLLPISPFPGAQLLEGLLMRAQGRSGFLLAQRINLATLGALALWGLVTREASLLVVAAATVHHAVLKLRGYRRGELPRPEALDWHGPFVEHLVALMEEGRPHELHRVAMRLKWEPGAPAGLLVLAYIATGEGDGRKARQHLEQWPRETAPAFLRAQVSSLEGDDIASLAEWEEAYARSPLRKRVRSGYAAALLRVGRADDARTVAGPFLPTAWLDDEFVLWGRGRFEEAALAAEQAYQLDPSADAALRAGCDWARAGRVEEALRWLDRARGAGFRVASTVREVRELTWLAQRAEFRAWVAGLRELPAR